MKKLIIPSLFVLLIAGCATPNEEKKQPEFSEAQLLQAVRILSHDSLEGRGFGSAGNKKARQYLSDQFRMLSVQPAFDQYEQFFNHTISKRLRQRMFPVEQPGEDYANVPDTTLAGGNIVVKIPGESEKVIAITAHLDHLGIRNGEIYNGADDDASGTAALLSIASYFNINQPHHTLIIAAVDGEEIGSPGAKYLVEHFPGGLDKVKLNVNLDMIAHNDSSELWVCGTYHYPQLKAPLEKLDSKLHLFLGHDNPADTVKQDWTRSSDHRIFHEKGIPFIYFGVEDHEDYHRPTDTYENINKEFYVDAVNLIIKAIETYDSQLN